MLNCLILILEMSSDDSNLEDPMAELKLVVAVSNGVTFFFVSKMRENRRPSVTHVHEEQRDKTRMSLLQLPKKDSRLQRLSYTGYRWRCLWYGDP